MPGHEFALGFLKRHKNVLSQRMCQNIEKSRASFSPEEISKYHDNLKETIKDVPPSHIINYDETNLTDDPDRKKIITKRGCKYPERIMNHSKTLTSIMFACTGEGEMLHVYIVYKSLHLYDTWCVGGPPGALYNRSISGWFDTKCFEDWLLKAVIPYVRHLPGKKVLIGDNLSSHLTVEGIKMCEKYEIECVFLPPNSTHLTQPLDVAFFRPLKSAWRKILTNWKLNEGRSFVSVPKNTSPVLLGRLLKEIEVSKRENIKRGFEKTGLIPLNRDHILSWLPRSSAKEVTDDNDVNSSGIIDDCIVSVLNDMRFSPGTSKGRKRKLNIPPGQSVSAEDLETDGKNGYLLENEQEQPNKIPTQHVYTDKYASKTTISSKRNQHQSSEPHTRQDSNCESQTDDEIMKGVYIKNGPIEEGDWVIVDFSSPSTSFSNQESSSKQSYFVGTIISDDNTCFTVTFLKYVPTKVDSGQIFKWPDHEDVCKIDKSSVVGVTKHPKLLRRGLMKFEINIHEW